MPSDHRLAVYRHLLDKIINLGTSKWADASVNRYVRLINFLALFTITASLFSGVFIVTVIGGGFSSIVRVLLMLLFSCSVIILNSLNKYGPAKFVSLLGPFIAVCVPPFITGYIHEGMLLWMPFGLMVFGSKAFIILSYGKERRLMLMMAGFSYLLTNFYDRLLVAYAPEPLDMTIFNRYWGVHAWSKLTMPVVFFSFLFLLKYYYYRSQVELARVNEELQEKNRQLAQFNDSLELQVAERTLLLEQQNKRVAEFVFANAHQLRASIARISGLSSILLQGVEDEEEKRYCIQKIYDNSLELNQVTQTLSRKLEEKEGIVSQSITS